MHASLGKQWARVTKYGQNPLHEEDRNPSYTTQLEDRQKGWLRVRKGVKNGDKASVRFRIAVQFNAD